MRNWAVFVACFMMAAVEAGSGVVPIVAYDNVHIHVPDPTKAGEWYVAHLGATPTQTPGRVFIGKTLIRFAKGQSSRSGRVDHIGLSFENVSAKLTELEAAGARVTTALRNVPGLFPLALIEDPWGVRIEVLQDSETLGFHHVHLRVRDPQATLDWYQEVFGGERTHLKGHTDGLRYGDVWLLATVADDVSLGDAAEGPIYQLAWRVVDTRKAFADLTARAVKSELEPREGAVEGRKTIVALVRDPNEISIELIQRKVP